MGQKGFSRPGIAPAVTFFILSVLLAGCVSGEALSTSTPTLAAVTPATPTLLTSVSSTPPRLLAV